MYTKTFQFKSVGAPFSDDGFFAFLVREKFRIEKSNVIQWCSIDGLCITCTALDSEIISWCEVIVKDGFDTPSGHKFILYII